MMALSIQPRGIFRSVMIVLCLSTLARASRRPAAFAALNARRSLNPTAMWAASYSATTIQRTKGKSQGQEFAKMADSLNLESEELTKLLANRLSNMEPGTDKAEYIDWLLTGDAGAASTTVSSPRTTTAPAAKPIVDAGTQTFATNVMFAERTDLHPNSKRAIAEVMGLTSMTEIQDRTFAAASSGKDVLGRARTGTGKTLAFLLPAIERILKSPEYVVGENVGIVVISPTRELATQIGDQAKKLLQFHPKMNVQVVFGGTNVKTDVNRLTRQMPTILVATPGRLMDHMQSTKIGGLRFGKDIMSKTPVVVLDETDRLLDMGFRNEIKKIFAYLPRGQDRQTLLFSATIPPELKKIMADNMKPDFIEVDCIKDGDAASHTNAQVQQSHVIVKDQDRFVSSVVEVLRVAMNDGAEAPKVVVFFPTARMVGFFSELFNVGLKISVMELHSKKSQGYRNRVSDEFRKCQHGVLFTSDVSARGVDYPNVSHVIQFGIPESREQYIHRLGRTGRGGTEGKGWLVLSPWESAFLQDLKGLQIPVNDELTAMFAAPMSAETENLIEPVKQRIGGGDQVLSKSAMGAYQAFLGYYLGQMRRMRMNRKEELVSIANNFAMLTGLKQPPQITSQLVAKMGLKNVAGLNIGGSHAPGGRGDSNRSQRGRNGDRRGGGDSRGGRSGRR